MSKRSILFRGPVKSLSGYGSHSRDLLKSLYDMDLFDIQIDSTSWGNTPLNALDKDNLFHKWIDDSIVTSLEEQPDIYIQVTVPNEFNRVGKFNIGITAGIETTAAPKSWVDGCNRMDLVLVTSSFSKDVLLQTVYNETDKVTTKLIKQHKIKTPIEILHEGVDLSTYYKTDTDFELDIEEDFAYLFVGHWLKGDLGQDRKDVGMLIKCFCESFNGQEERPALVLKTSSATFSIKEREKLRKKIQNLTSSYDDPPSIYLLFGQLSDSEMNGLYNHSKIKSMVSITKGEGFGRPLLEFSVTGKPVIASNWSGHKDFLPMDMGIMIGGSLTNVHKSASDDFVLTSAKWFTANYEEFIQVLRIVFEKYDDFIERSEKLKEENTENFSIEKVTSDFKDILTNIDVRVDKPKKVDLKIPKLTKIEEK
jgi:glycosyltransferase involved in cell wall biosynthesis